MNHDSKPPVTVDLTPLLAPGATASAAVVGGVRVGDAADLLRDVPLTSADPQARHVIREGQPPERLADGTERPLPERIEAVLAEGGWVRAGDCAWLVADGRVVRIVVRGTGLAGLPLGSHEDLERRLGPPDGTEKTSPSSTHYHYLARDLTLCWSTRLGSLEYVLLGAVDWVDPVLTGRDLAVQLVEAQHRLKTYAWGEPPADDLGATVRYQRLRALSAALGLPTVAALIDGSFFTEEHDERCGALIDRLRVAGGLRLGRTPFPTCPEDLYQDLLRYRLDAQVLLEHNAGWFECADTAHMGIVRTTNHVNEQLAELLRPIEDLLGEFLDPAQRRVPRSVLVRDYGYPELEPEAADLAEDAGDHDDDE
jgi:hypothetical protein